MEIILQNKNDNMLRRVHTLHYTIDGEQRANMLINCPVEFEEDKEGNLTDIIKTPEKKHYDDTIKLTPEDLVNYIKDNLL